MLNRGAFLALTLIGSLLVSVFTVSVVHAQTNAITQLVPFQGRLHDSDGKVVDDGVYDLTFYVYDTATGGVFKWSENHAQVSVIHGYVNVLLGGTDSGAFADKNVDFSTQKYLSISINGGQEMFPRHQLVPTFHAFNTSKLGEIDAADYATDIELTDAVKVVDDRVTSIVETNFEANGTTIKNATHAASATNASYASNAGKLDNETKAQLRDASKLTGTISDARLPSVISREKIEAATTTARGATKKNQMSNATNGYFWDKETGYIVQWGEVNTTGVKTISFPTTFTNVRSGSVTLKLDGGWSGSTTVQIGMLSNSQMRIQRSVPLGSGSYNVYWQAFGYKAP